MDGEAYKSVFVLVLSTEDLCKPELHELKIQEGGKVMGGGGPFDPEPHLVLDPVAKLFDKANLEVTNYCFWEVASCSHSKLYILLDDSSFVPYWNFITPTDTVASQPLTGIVFDMETKSLDSFQPPKASKPGGIVICAYKQLYHLSNPCYTRFTEASFERYDPATDSWEDLPVLPSKPEQTLEIVGYAVYGRHILVSLQGHKRFKFSAFHVDRKTWRRVKTDKVLSFHDCYPFRRRAVVVNDTIYALSCDFGEVIAFSFCPVTCSISSPFLFPGIHKVPMSSPLYGRQSEYMVHLGNLEFCLVQSAYNYHGNCDRQPLWITTFQIVDGPCGFGYIKNLNSTRRDVYIQDSDRFEVAFSFTPDCEDIEEERGTTVGGWTYDAYSEDEGVSTDEEETMCKPEKESDWITDEYTEEEGVFRDDEETICQDTALDENLIKVADKIVHVS